jgi:hypothetical protein
MMTPAGLAADHVGALALTGAGPMAGGADRHAADRVDPPYDARGRDSLNLPRAIRPDLSRSQFVFGRTLSNIAGQEAAKAGPTATQTSKVLQLCFRVVSGAMNRSEYYVLI